MTSSACYLLDVGEWALKEASLRAARELRIKPIAIWRELVRNVLVSHAGPVHPVLFLCHQIRKDLMLSLRRSDRLPVHGALLQGVREGKAGALALLLLLFDLRYRDPAAKSKSVVMNADDVPDSSSKLGMVASDTVGFDKALQSRQFNHCSASELHCGQSA